MYITHNSDLVQWKIRPTWEIIRAGKKKFALN